MIKLENVTKIYPGSTTPAVQDLTMQVPEGETCVLIGPSGCGKTTTMKMINRLIEPSDGQIYVNGNNVMQQDPVRLRRDIGYVIQQIGLFPHMTIEDNISVVPQLKGWDKNRTSKRIDELLDMVGLEPSQFRKRYPRELSGGQRQRVGVARALAADPPVMLMDEPFGAIDPITRDHLQNEFLRLQRRINKTIVFVTHDIDEAIKMGTLICILAVGGVLQQLDTPTNLLANPVNAFVADFVGADRGLKRLNLVRVGSVMRTDFKAARYDSVAADVVSTMQEEGTDSLLVVDDADRLVGYVTLEAAQEQPTQQVKEIARDVVSVTEEEATMKNAFSEMLSYGVGYLPVIGHNKRLVGIITAGDAQRLIETGPQA
ncbi:MAG TPA: ABC transporter ATP-binding protein [Candidatus Sulfomarinibacteraceae bacterium]|nr:ABC transporter ATP-binding protein [Candidatus Sulfomarinibacteraceae bacterium]